MDPGYSNSPSARMQLRGSKCASNRCGQPRTRGGDKICGVGRQGPSPSLRPRRAIGGMNLEDVRILLVEDNPVDARMLRDMIRDACSGPIHLQHVDRLSRALDSLGTGQFDVVLLDLSLPDARGLETVA